ncbi:hypothetical protein [Desulfocicer vacuolatum]|uniref:hypothetical protein n=1 Tax=Desulfocicer vacuolatum TaxID=2298 RepID=UPI001BB0C3D2|nr:hypothetical protein [Desulfocicer vacuolatum]
MKYSVSQGCISSFVVGRTESKQGLPAAVVFNFVLPTTKLEKPMGCTVFFDKRTV